MKVKSESGIKGGRGGRSAVLNSGFEGGKKRFFWLYWGDEC